MEPVLLEILCCPLCKGELELRDAEEREGEIVAGVLVCRACGERYPIEDGIPNMLPPDQRHGG
ncbi:MAG: hypothetical protein KatS3mg063_0797 [Tepidiforma sp.]|jgi:uncharacterized protein YbaR (Trm112 family)|uniref:Trm112 family protein n=1 Tax=Tepidiforma bonchosmolovskayae TaxID=2601677 RepID=A0ABX6C3A9_9CHLR|nr:MULTISPECIES: methytransferase partner Trm112 [Tepidiforma]QFG03294.1 Trm112 family protein [Tepidiforma bonchosmolovskayae]GIW14944.1 MAG: hypothetical protein KatS3mg063_0797 [Tepidiforma sp.]